MHRLPPHFDRHVTAEPIIGGAIDFAHPARTEQRDDLVSPIRVPGTSLMRGSVCRWFESTRDSVFPM
jgi:hypothetical protein